MSETKHSTDNSETSKDSAEVASVVQPVGQSESEDIIRSENKQKMSEKEQAYVESSGNSLLAEQYSDELVSSVVLDNDINAFVQEKQKVNATMDVDKALNRSENDSETGHEVKLSDEELKGELTEQTAEKIKEIAKARAEFHFPDADKYVGHQEKADALNAESSQYTDLLIQTIGEKSIAGLTGAEALKLIENNIDLMAYQDRKSSETTVGDHGIRHIYHNIDRCNQIFDSLASEPNAQNISAMDRLIAHQTMIMHDVGYTAEPIAKDTPGHDKGHNALSAKIAGEHLSDPDDPLAKVFTENNAMILHQSILEHDGHDIDFDMENKLSPEESRQKRIESAVQIADNLHAFETKLPELLFSIPETLETMLLLKSAGETGASEGDFEEIKDQLINKIGLREDIAPDDKKALEKAVRELSGNSYSFQVGRLCGKDPEISVNESGKVIISVEESEIHQQSIALFNMQEYTQFTKWVKDVTGEGKNKNDPEGSAKVDADINEALHDKDKSKLDLGIFEISLRTSKNNSEAKKEDGKEKTKFEKGIESIISDELTKNFAIKDIELSKQQALATSDKDRSDIIAERANKRNTFLQAKRSQMENNSGKAA